MDPEQMVTRISTARLDLTTMTPAFLRASLGGRIGAAASLIRLSVPGTWPDNQRLLALRLQQLEADPTLQPWLLRAMALRATGQMVGYIGFHTRPGPEYLDPWSPGAVEFGFTVFPAHRGNGYAREAAEGMMRWAREVHGVNRFVLTIAPGNLPSQAIAQRLGFTRIGQHVDEDDGPEDVFALDFGVSPAMQKDGDKDRAHPLP